MPSGWLSIYSEQLARNDELECIMTATEEALQLNLRQGAMQQQAVANEHTLEIQGLQNFLKDCMLEVDVYIL